MKINKQRLEFPSTVKAKLLLLLNRKRSSSHLLLWCAYTDTPPCNRDNVKGQLFLPVVQFCLLLSTLMSGLIQCYSGVTNWALLQLYILFPEEFSLGSLHSLCYQMRRKRSTLVSTLFKDLLLTRLRKGYLPQYHLKGRLQD
mgnify:CR=1 FL=1